MASFIDSAPPGLVVENMFNYYSGSAGDERSFPIGINLAARLNVTSYADIIVVAYGTPYGILDGKFTLAAVIPYVWAEVTGELSGPRRTFSRRDTAEGLGDITLIPIWLAWNKGEFKWDVRLGIYAPTGEYNKNDLANVGLNYWTFEPTVSLSYLSKKIGLEVTAFAGLDFNTKNDAVDGRRRVVRVDRLQEQRPGPGSRLGARTQGLAMGALLGDEIYCLRRLHASRRASEDQAPDRDGGWRRSHDGVHGHLSLAKVRPGLRFPRQAADLPRHLQRRQDHARRAGEILVGMHHGVGATRGTVGWRYRHDGAGG